MFVAAGENKDRDGLWLPARGRADKSAGGSEHPVAGNLGRAGGGVGARARRARPAPPASLSPSPVPGAGPRSRPSPRRARGPLFVDGKRAGRSLARVPLAGPAGVR